MKTLRIYAKRILTICSFALLLQSTVIAQTSPWDTVKQRAGTVAGKVGGAFERAGQDISGAATKAFEFVSAKAKQAIDAASNKVMSMSLNKERLFNTVQNKMASAGDRVRKIANCMATGKECNVADRVILVATASFIFVALIVLAGSSIGVAARSKIVEDAKKEQAQQVKGWGPKQMAQRLGTIFSDGKNKFVPLKDGIIKGQLTRSQRNFLIGLGASIIGATLVLTAVLTGLAVYSAQQEEKQKAEIERQRRLTDTETETTVPAAPGIPTAPLPPALKPTGKFGFVGDLKNLAKEVSTKIEEKITPMQEYFKKDVIEKGTNTLQTAATNIQTLLKEKTTAAKRALITTVEENKQKLAELAQKKLNEAKKVAQEFMSEIKAGGEQFYQSALEKILGVTVANIQPSIDKINHFAARVGKAFAPLGNVRIMGQIQTLTNNVNELVAKASTLGGKWKEALTELVSRATWISSHVRPELLGGKSNEELTKEANQKYPLAKQADDIWNFYPKLVAAINDLKLGGPGIIVNNALKITGLLLGALQGLNQAAGKIGKTLISKELSNSLATLRDQLTLLGSNVRTTTVVKPLLKVFPASTPGALLEVLKGYAWRVGTDLHTQIINQVNQITAMYNNVVAPGIEGLKREQAKLVDKVNAIPGNIKKQFMAKLKEKPIETTATAPVQLALILGSEVSGVKADVTSLTNVASELLQGVANMILLTPPMLQLINQATGGDFINPDLTAGLNAISNNIRDIKNNLRNVNEGVQKSIPIVPAAA